jgi:hypothetical protein
MQLAVSYETSFADVGIGLPLGDYTGYVWKGQEFCSPDPGLFGQGDGISDLPKHQLCGIIELESGPQLPSPIAAQLLGLAPSNWHGLCLHHMVVEIINF